MVLSLIQRLLTHPTLRSFLTVMQSIHPSIFIYLSIWYGIITHTTPISSPLYELGIQGMIAEVHLRRIERLTVSTVQVSNALCVTYRDMLSEYVHYSDTRINRIISSNVIGMTVALKLRKQVNVAVAGNMGSGKSTLIGVLSTGQYDNGKGSARTQVMCMFINDDDDDCTIVMYDIKILVYMI